jgi:hypothetical protein
MDFTEIDLWWLLLHKRRRSVVTGHTFYYRVVVPGSSELPLTQIQVLRSLHANVLEVSAQNYAEGYRLLLPYIEQNVARYPELLPSEFPGSPDFEKSQIADGESEIFDNRQLPLPIRSTRRRRRVPQSK